MDRDGYNDFALTHLENDSLYLYIFNPERTPVKIFLYAYDSFKHQREEWRTCIASPIPYRENCILFYACTNYDFEPRGIYCLNLKTEKIEWSTPLPGNGYNLILTDRGILVSSTSPANGREVRGEKDRDGWIYLMNGRGGIKWKKNLGFGIDPYLLDRFNDTLWVYGQQHWGNEGDSSLVTLIDCRSGETIKEIKYPGKSYTVDPVQTIDINGEKLFCFCNHSEGFIFINKKLEEKRKLTSVERGSIFLLRDVILENKTLLGVRSNNQNGYIYNIQGKLLTKIDDVIRMQTLRREGNRNGILAYGRGSHRVYEMVPVKISPVQILILAGFLLGIYVMGYLIFRLIIYIKLRGLLLSDISSHILITDRKGEILSADTDFSSEVSEKVTRGKSITKNLKETPLRKISEVAEKSIGDREETTENISLRVNDEEHSFILRVRILKVFNRPYLYLFLLNDVTETLRAKKYETLFAFSRIVTHDIKNPLSSLRMLLDKIRQKETGREVREFTEKGIDEVRSMKKLTNTILKLTRDKLTRKMPVELNEIIKEVVDQFPLEEEKVTFELDPEGVIIEGDRDLLRMAFSNVFKNALDATDENESITIITEKKDSEGIVKFIDEGIGMSEDERRRVFSPDFSKKEGGSGLGLYITRDIIHKHNGVIRLSSKEGEGTEVGMSFELRDP